MAQWDVLGETTSRRQYINNSIDVAVPEGLLGCIRLDRAIRSSSVLFIFGICGPEFRGISCKTAPVNGSQDKEGKIQ